MLGDHLAKLLFGRSHVDHHLPVDLVQHLHGQQRNRIYRRGQHDQIGSRNRFVQRKRAIDQSQFDRLGAVALGIIHSDHFLANAFIFQGQCERSPDQPDTYYRRLHSNVLILSIERCNNSSVAQRLIRTYRFPSEPKMPPGVRKTPQPFSILSENS